MHVCQEHGGDLGEGEAVQTSFDHQQKGIRFQSLYRKKLVTKNELASMKQVQVKDG